MEELRQLYPVNEVDTEQDMGAYLQAALTRMLQLYFGTDDITFTVISANPLANPPTRTYHRFSDLAQDTVDVRIYQGIHFRFGDEEGRKQGRHVAQWVFGHFLRPID